MMDVISAKRLDSLVDYAKLEVTAQCYRDSFGYETCELVKFVRGKREFFDFKKVGPLVDDAKKVFNEIGVNPIYAQLILLIESPNNPRARSISGAVGHYQLMPFVAKKYGLVITSARDDRHDFALSSMAAAKLMRDYCIPNAQRMAVSVGLEPNFDQLWFQLLVMHVYNAGAGNVRKAVAAVGEVKSGEELIMKLWKTQAGAFGNSSQNYSQLALASYINYLDWLRED
jgi:soluble lytic murein transglycosylase-like protein